MKCYKFTSVILAASILFFASEAMAARFIVSYEAEAPGIQNSTATFSMGGVETFDQIPAQTYPQKIIADFGTSGAKITGTYRAGNGNGIQINTADQYGAADGKGNYIVAFQKDPYSLTLAAKGGVNYFGFWLSALDRGNFVTFYGSNGKVLFNFDPQDVLNAVNGAATPSLYYGNPNPSFKGQDSSEPFVFLNFFDTTGSFSKVEFSEVGFGGGYESDNHTVGRYLTYGQGTVVPLKFSTSVPEVSTWAMMLIGFGLIGFVGSSRARLARMV